MSEDVVLHLHCVSISISNAFNCLLPSTSIMMIMCIRVEEWWTQSEPAVSPPPPHFGPLSQTVAIRVLSSGPGRFAKPLPPSPRPGQPLQAHWRPSGTATNASGLLYPPLCLVVLTAEPRSPRTRHLSRSLLGFLPFRRSNIFVG